MSVKGTTIFLAGIIQGSLSEKAIHSQDYRETITNILARCWREANVFCPVEDHPTSLEYSFDEARRTFHQHLEKVKSSDILIAYLPEASMGTAIEMYLASLHGRYVVAITPMKFNWVVRIFSNAVYASVEDFAEACKSRKLQRAYTGFMSAKSSKTTHRLTTAPKSEDKKQERNR